MTFGQNARLEYHNLVLNRVFRLQLYIEIDFIRRIECCLNDID